MPGLANELWEDSSVMPASTHVNEIEGAPKNGCLQYLYPQGELPPHFTSPGDSPRPEVRSDTGSYQITFFTLGHNVPEILWVLLKSGVSIFPSPIGVLQLNPVGLQNQMLWRLIFLCQTPSLEKLTWGSELLLLQYSYSPVCGLPTVGGGGMRFGYITNTPLSLIVIPFLCL